MAGQQSTSTRRTFLTGLAAASAGALTAASQSAGAESAGRRDRRAYTLIKPDDVVLFQGDSITDAGRDRNRQGNPNDVSALGRGYAFLAACQVLADCGPGVKVYNRGISGHKVYQLGERWQADCLDLKPNVLSILIGVNDIWHKLNGQYDGTVEKYENDYVALLQRTKEAMPEVRLVICEPFVLRCGAVNEKWFPEFDAFRAAARRVSDKFAAVFVPYQTMFDEAVSAAPPQHWAGDGVHPSMAGASLMARAWLRAVRGGGRTSR